MPFFMILFLLKCDFLTTEYGFIALVLFLFFSFSLGVYLVLILNDFF